MDHGGLASIVELPCNQISLNWSTYSTVFTPLFCSEEGNINNQPLHIQLLDPCNQAKEDYYEGTRMTTLFILYIKQSNNRIEQDDHG